MQIKRRKKQALKLKIVQVPRRTFKINNLNLQ